MRAPAVSGQSQAAPLHQSAPDPAIAQAAAVPNALVGLIARLVIAFAKETALA
jgi:hypothetical protein